ncbi:hypothetical protein D3C75_1030790 [compost metagenome]
MAQASGELQRPNQTAAERRAEGGDVLLLHLLNTCGQFLLDGGPISAFDSPANGPGNGKSAGHGDIRLVGRAARLPYCFNKCWQIATWQQAT